MKKYEKKYEDVFRNKRSLKSYKVEKVEILDNFGFDEYVTKFKQEYRDYQISLFDHWVKLDWLLDKFSYAGVKRKGESAIGWHYGTGYSMFFRNVVGIDNMFLKRGTPAFRQIITYFDDFFQGIDDSPFDVEYKFPYDYLTLDYLIFVYQMDERLELLEEANSKRMTLIDFYDHVINYASCVNNDIDKEKYNLVRGKNYMPYIVNNE